MTISTVFASCSKDELNGNEEAFEIVLGNWVSTTVINNGVDVSDSGNATISFREDATFFSTAVENGIELSFEGTFEFMEEGTKLKLDYPVSGGLANYDVLKLTDADMTLEITAFGDTVRSDFERQ